MVERTRNVRSYIYCLYCIFVLPLMGGILSCRRPVSGAVLTADLTPSICTCTISLFALCGCGLEVRFHGGTRHLVFSAEFREALCCCAVGQLHQHLCLSVCLLSCSWKPHTTLTAGVEGSSRGRGTAVLSHFLLWPSIYGSTDTEHLATRVSLSLYHVTVPESAERYIWSSPQCYRTK